MNGHEKVTSNVVKIIMASMTIGYMIEYELVDATLRKSINLKRWKNEIITSVKSVLPNAQVDIFKDFYRITVTILPTLYELQLIGKKIASHKRIGKNVRVHEYITRFKTLSKSKKLFKRKEQPAKSINLI